jgi:trimeric autotransporter adhesin
VNVIGAGMNLANNPTLDSSSIFGLVGGKSPFQPTLTSAPGSLAVQLAQASGGLSYSASAFVFPATYVGFPVVTQTLTVTNNGPLAVGLIPVGSLQIVGLNAGDFSFDTSCNVSPGLAVGQTCGTHINFTPAASGAENATLLVAFDGVAPQSCALSGNGLAHTGSSLTLSPSSLTFTHAGVPQPVTLTNNGATPIALGPISVFGGTGTNNCGAMVAAQSICTMEVQASAMTDNSNVGTTGVLKVMDSGNPGGKRFQ